MCEDKVLVELNKEQCQTGFAVGDIYLGKVRKIMPGLNAAFVNIGHEKDAFIHYLDLGPQFPSLQKLVASQQPGKRGFRVESMKLEPPVEKTGKIGEYLQVGQQIMVQVAKEAISTKGPRLTADISLAGRNVVLVPFTSKVFLSQKIRSADEKKRLKRIAAAVLPKNFGVIIRTAAMEAKDEDIEHDIQTQIDRWRKTCAAIKKNAASAPAQLMSEMNRANTIIRDSLNGSFSQIAVDDEAMYNEIRGYIRQIEPEKEKIVKLYKGNVPIFDNFDISKQIKSLFAKYVSLKRGAYLIIERTEAMNVIDVNSGNRTKAEDNQEQTAMDVNLAAAAEIARQLRLRDLGGIVIIDFIDLHKAQNRQALYDEMVKLMATDTFKGWDADLANNGICGLCYNYYDGARSFMGHKAYKTPADLKGAVIRTPGADPYVESISAMGATPYNIAWSEVYNGIQTKSIDGCEVQYTSAVSSKIYEVCEYVSKTEHINLFNMVICGQAWFDKLPAEYQEVMKKDFNDCAYNNAQDIIAAQADMEKTLTDNGMTIVEVDKDVFREAVKPAYEKLGWTELREQLYKEAGVEA